MTRLMFAAAALAVVATPAFAKEEKGSFTRDGVTYNYRLADKGDYTVITGSAFPGSRNFRLVVRGNRVTGHNEGTPVAFTVPAEKK
jgi:hypothetical protein